jgi:hypothetical protein
MIGFDFTTRFLHTSNARLREIINVMLVRMNYFSKIPRDLSVLHTLSVILADPIQQIREVGQRMSGISRSLSVKVCYQQLAQSFMCPCQGTKATWNHDRYLLQVVFTLYGLSYHCGIARLFATPRGIT